MAQQEAQHGDHGGGAEQEGEHRADRLADLIVLLCADGAGDDDLPRGGKAHRHKGQQMQDVASDGDRGHARRADAVADDDHVYEVVHGLQGVGGEQRHRKAKQLRDYGPPGHIADHRVCHAPASFVDQMCKL